MEYEAQPRRIKADKQRILNWTWLALWLLLVLNWFMTSGSSCICGHIHWRPALIISPSLLLIGLVLFLSRGLSFRLNSVLTPNFVLSAIALVFLSQLTAKSVVDVLWRNHTPLFDEPPALFELSRKFNVLLPYLSSILFVSVILTRIRTHSKE